MSLISRTKYLAALVDKANKRLSPLIEEFNKIKDSMQESLNSLEEDTDKLNSKIDLAKIKGQHDLAATLEVERDSLVLETKNRVESTFSNIRESVVNSMNGITEEIDGIKVTASISDSGVLQTSIEPKLTNLTTEFVKETIEDPSTVAVVNTIITGTAAGGLAITATGTALAPLKTT